MKIVCRKKIALGSKKEAIVIPVYKNIENLKALTGKRVEDEIKKILNSDFFYFEDNEIKSFYIEINKKIKKVYLINIPKEPEEYRDYMKLGSKFADILKKDKIYTFSVLSIEDIYNERKDFNYTKSFIEGIYFGLYEFDRYKSKKSEYELEEIEIITNSNKTKKVFDEEMGKLDIIFNNVNMVRDLVNLPHADLTPQIFADFIKKYESDKLKVTIFDYDTLQEEGFGLIVAVGKGGVNKPCMVKAEYKGDPESEENVALVGKGVTFDSGGMNLKPTGHIETMKTDMAGAATVFGIIKTLHDLNEKINVYAYIPLVENIISHESYKPGDIIKSKSGKTVEILNTDAEGRLILADALYEATKTDPEIIIDMATLTGACVVALGSYCAGLFSNRKFLAKNISDLSYDLCEDIWELPLYEEYKDRIKGDISDLINIAKKRGEAGSIIAALFLQEFVDNYPWIHLDIAGTAYVEEKHPIFGKGATGFGLRLIYSFIKKFYIEKK
ncbi:leucyl aminopeptidase [Deferribacter desulfuricans SSM1]|uniref:Probable cytosol aminopeptidase n=1 Tax=Deferribacter desulfuricans (strain DSM 14783 / JCM 11476 / NBRC 101012 / SSM1) TaxID=639282 RepID=D3P9Y1_DEFDS|nr:leucyl aminopeptidase family protein [Deferribacter desulfuricans]BAI81521.1 leucyl aminopeptidase [Deferribacter desulfuricans SSM1]